MSHFRRIPHTPYYGTAYATIFYIIAQVEAWRWLGDDPLFSKRARGAHEPQTKTLNA